MRRRIWLWLCRVFGWISFALRFYYSVSKRYQRMQLTWARKGPPLPEFQSLAELEDVLSRMKWRPDTWRQWYDTFEHPRAIWAKYLAAPDRGVEDCDGFAIFAANRLADMMCRGVTLGDAGHIIVGVYVLTVPYLTGWVIEGHNVCLVSYWDVQCKRYCWGYIGNWFGGKLQSGYQNPWGIITEIAGQSDLIQWAIATPDLKLVDHGWHKLAKFTA